MKKITTILMSVLFAATLFASAGCGVELYTKKGQIEDENTRNRNLAELIEDIRSNSVRSPMIVTAPK